MVETENFGQMSCFIAENVSLVFSHSPSSLSLELVLLNRCRWSTPIPVYKLSLLFSIFKSKAPDTRSPPTWVISQPLTFPSFKQAPVCALIDPADGLGANLPGDRQEVTVFHCSIWCNYPQNKHILDSSWPSSERGWVGVCVGVLGHAFVTAVIYQSGRHHTIKYILSKGVTEEEQVNSVSNEPSSSKTVNVPQG